MDAASAAIHFDVAVDGMEIVQVGHAGDAQRAVYGAHVPDVRSPGNVNGVFDGDFNAFVLRITRGNSDRPGFGVHIDRNAVEVGLTAPGGFHRLDLDFIAVPTLHLDGAVYVL